MQTRLQLRAVIAATFMVFALACGNVHADPVPLVTGEHWTKSSEQLKKAYLIGIANVILIDTAYNAANVPSEAQSLLPRIAKGMKGQTLDSVRLALDQWYATHPDKLNQPVIETIWFEMVVPGLQKQG